MKPVIKLSILFFVLIFFISLSYSAKAELFGVDSKEGQQSSDFYSIDTSIGTASFIGNTGFRSCNGFDFHPLTNKGYAVCSRPGEFADVLIMIVRKNGQGTEVGPLNNFGQVSDVSFRSDGVLFAYNNAQGGDTLGTINLETGNFTEIGPTGLPGSFPGIGFSQDDVLFMAGENILDNESLLILNQDTGQATFITELSNLPFQKFPRFTSLDNRPQNGVLFGSYIIGGTGESILSTVDTDSGFVTNIGEEGALISAIAFLNPNPTRPIPTLSQYGLILTAIVLFAASLFILRRRSKISEA